MTERRMGRLGRFAWSNRKHEGNLRRKVLATCKAGFSKHKCGGMEEGSREKLRSDSSYE